MIQSAPGTLRPPFEFSAEDAAFLNEVQHGAFNYLWNAVSEQSGMVLDRPSEPIVSVAGVGFQLAGIPVGVERGWITRQQGQQRCEQILAALLRNPAIRKAGLFQHFLDAKTAGIHSGRLEHVISTVDSALLFAGAIVAGEYFGGTIKSTVDGMVLAADWPFFVGGEQADPGDRGFVSLGWKPTSLDDPSGEGGLLNYYWLDSGCEHRLVTFLAVCSPDEAKRLPPDTYYRLRRGVGRYDPVGPMVFFPYSGALFVNQFSHIFMPYAAMGPDNPADSGVARRPRVDWWENSRRHTLMHRHKAIGNLRQFAGFGENAWGLTASDVPDGYGVPGLFPTPLMLANAIPVLDYPTLVPKDDYGDGTIAPYAAGCSIMFEPTLAIQAMRHYRALAAQPGMERLWSDPAKGGFGFGDAFNVGKKWVAADHLAIDHGPLLLAIENARSGFVWKMFVQNAAIGAGLGRLKLSNLPQSEAPAQVSAPTP
ncbi:MAG: glucoamylase family protein [Phycisphaerales bacterium]